MRPDGDTEAVGPRVLQALALVPRNFAALAADIA